MDKPINERYIKLSSRIPFPRDIQLGDDIHMLIDTHNILVNCVKIEQEDNQDGTINVIYKLKSLTD